MSVFCRFQRFFRWVICAPLVTVGAEQYANAYDSCAINLYRAYDNTDSSYLHNYTDSADTVSLGGVSYVAGQAWPTTGLVAPTHNGYSFDGYYMGNTRYYSSSMTSVTNAPQICIAGGLLAHWTLMGCPAGVDNIDFSPPTSVTTAGTTSVSLTDWAVVLNTDRKLVGYWACSNIPGGYNAAYGYSTAAYGAISTSDTGGKYCWCRLDRVDRAVGAAWQQSLNGYNSTQWVYSGTYSTSCNNNCATYCANKAAGTAGANTLFRKTLYGQNCPFTIQYDYTSGHTNTTLAPTSYTYEDAPVDLPTPVPSNNSEVFAGWYTSSDLSGSPVTSISRTTSDTANKHYYAKWECATGYTQGVCPLNGKWGSRISGNYDYISQDGIYFSPNAANLTLFNSEWQQKFANNNNGTFIVRGKSVCSESSSVPAGTAPSSTGGKYCWCKPTLYIDENNNYYGVGTVSWWLGTGGFSDEPSCISGCAAKCEQKTLNLKCESGCQPNVCFVNYHYVSNGDETWPTPRMTPALFSAETPVASFTVSNPSRPNYAFVAWCENAGLSTNCSGTKTIATNSCTTDQSVINLYANWNRLYTLSYACDNGATPPSSTNVVPGNVSLADEDSACNGHTPCETVRWNCVDANNNNVNVFNGHGHSNITMPAANVTCTLVRNTISYEIRVDGNGGSGELTVNGSGLLIPQGGSFQCQCGTTVTLPEWGAPDNTLTQNGKVFTGWVDSSTGNPITESFDCADTKVVATWCDCVQNCTAGSNSASCRYTGVVNNSCSYDYSCSTGYNNNGVASGSYYAAAGTCPSPATGPSCNGNEIVLQWYSQNTQLNNEPQSCIYGTPYSAATGAISPIVPPTRPGYDFAGWTVTGHQQ